jgi:hypothetical protein
MTPSVAEILQLVETMARRLKQPVDNEMRAGGWSDKSAVSMSDALDKFADKIRSADELPAMSERPWDMIRGLDSHGIHGAGPYDELLALGHSLRRAP